jgi:hypothetical protein
MIHAYDLPVVIREDVRQIPDPEPISNTLADGCRNGRRDSQAEACMSADIVALKPTVAGVGVWRTGRVMSAIDLDHRSLKD